MNINVLQIAVSILFHLTGEMGVSTILDLLPPNFYKSQAAAIQADLEINQKPPSFLYKVEISDENDTLKFNAALSPAPWEFL